MAYSCCVHTDGRIITFRMYNGELVSVAYQVPPVEHEDTILSGGPVHYQSLDGPLAKFSPKCVSCARNGPTSLVFPKGPLDMFAILSDRALSAILIDETSANLTQVCLAYVACMYIYKLYCGLSLRFLTMPPIIPYKKSFLEMKGDRDAKNEWNKKLPIEQL